MDNAFSGRAFPGFTTAQLKTAVAEGRGTEKMVAEIARREAVASGDMSKASPAERLRAAQK
jgi:hypothetical protein